MPTYQVFRFGLWSCETKLFSTIPWCPPLLCMQILDTRIFWNTEGFPHEFFSTVRQKLFVGKSWYSPISYPYFFSYQKISETQKGPLTKFFGPVRQKIFDKTMMPPSYAWKFSIPKFFETQKSSPTKFFGTMRQKSSDRKSWYPLLMLKNFSIPEIFWYTELLPNKIFRYCQTKNFERKVVICTKYKNQWWNWCL